MSKDNLGSFGFSALSRGEVAYVIFVDGDFREELRHPDMDDLKEAAARHDLDEDEFLDNFYKQRDAYGFMFDLPVYRQYLKDKINPECPICQEGSRSTRFTRQVKKVRYYLCFDCGNTFNTPPAP